MNLAIAVCLLPMGFSSPTLNPVSPVAVTVSKETYAGWSDSYRISNGTVDLVVVPKVGRIMRYGYVGERNFLWENPGTAGKEGSATGYLNHGGDKVWPAPQSVWNWPPDAALDGSPWTVETLPNGVRITSPVGKLVKVRIVRDITLAPLGTNVDIKNRMENLGDRQRVAVWQVTQVAPPDMVSLPFEIAPEQPRGWHGYGNEKLDPKFHEQTREELRLKRDPNSSRKFGAFSTKGRITSTFGTTRFVSEIVNPVVRQNFRYPDKNSPLQVYLSGDPSPYIEMELNSPLQAMDRGESHFLSVRWRLEGK